MYKLTALEGRRRVLGEEHIATLTWLNNLGGILHYMEDYKGALNYYQQALRVQEKVLGKTHPDTLRTILNVAITYEDGLKNFEKSEEMYRLALYGNEKSLGRDHENAKRCARGLAVLLQMQELQADLQNVLNAYPHIEDNSDWDSDEGGDEEDEEESSD